MQNELRLRCAKYQIDYGVKSCFICEKLNLDQAYFCRWRKGQKDLNNKHFELLSEFLTEKGY